jgi:hypothetical protein
MSKKEVEVFVEVFVFDIDPRYQNLLRITASGYDCFDPSI